MYESQRAIDALAETAYDNRVARGMQRIGAVECVTEHAYTNPLTGEVIPHDKVCPTCGAAT